MSARAGAARCRPLRGFVLLTAAAGLVALAAPVSAATVEDVAISPALPTWHDEVRVTVSGYAGPFCGAGGLRLTEKSPPSYGDVTFVLECSLPGPSRNERYTVSADIGRHLPGTYALQVVDGAGNPLAGNRSLLVYGVGNGVLRLPPAATSDAAVGIDVSFLRCPGCASGAAVSVQGKVIVISYVSMLPAYWVPSVPDAAHVELPPLVPGDYEVHLVGSGDLTFAPPGRVVELLVTDRLRVWDAAGCVPNDTSLCLQRGRFRVTGNWRDFQGRTGVAHASSLPSNDTTGLLWFFEASNPELTVKVLDGCGLGGHWWAFVASGSTVEYDLTVTDTRTGAIRSYHNDLGQVPALVADTSAFDSCGG